MPQRDDRISRHFGKLPRELWLDLGRNPGREAENALISLFDYRREGGIIQTSASPLNGVPRNIWLMPAVSDELDAVSQAENVSITAILIAAIRRHIDARKTGANGDAGSGGAPPRKRERKKKSGSAQGEVSTRADCAAPTPEWPALQPV